jgi:hypothetical protein
MEKNRFLLIPFIVGAALVILSWWQSYPLGVTTLDGVIFDRISTLYWIGLPILLFSLFMLIITLKNDSIKCLAAFVLVFSMYSLPLFYSSSPGSDSHQFIGLTEYFIKTGNLDPTLPYHLYYEFPFFFILGKIAVDVSGIVVQGFGSVLYTIIGFLTAVALYKYFSSRYQKGAFLALTAFFIPMFYFLNYQYAPFSLAFALFLVSIMLEATPIETRGKLIASLFLFTGMALTHAFVPVFFLLYVLIMYFFTRKTEHLRLFMLTTSIFFLIQITQASLTFSSSIQTLLRASSEYGIIAQEVLAPASASIDKIAQTVSRPLVIATVLLVVLSFVYVLARKRGLLSRSVDKAVFISGAIYSVLGAFVPVLGSRAIPLAFIPVLLGVAYLYESKFKILIITVLAISLVLFISLPIHGSFYDLQTMYQTQEAYRAENFMVTTFNWTHPSFILAHTRVVTYLAARQPSTVNYESDFSRLFPRFKDYDSILYTIGLGKNMLRYNTTIEDVVQQGHINLVYDNGFSLMTIKSSNLTWAPTS